LRIFSSELSSREIETILSIRGTRKHEKGEIRNPGHPGAWEESFWTLESSLNDESTFPEHAASLLSTLEPRIEAIRLLSKKCRIDLFCGFSSRSGQGGFVLDVPLLNRLCKFGVPLVLDLYPPTIENEPSGRE
jgi:hypothetical protein